ncbi:MAG TPA: polyphosphate kinase [Sphingomicrobium sp.]|nr:polyphosphate kinase [Sphingomicrobium sp.]
MPFTGNYPAALAGLQERLAQLQLAQIVHAKRALIIFEGPSGSGKKDALRPITAALDPCHFATHSVGDARDEGRHWLAPFWNALPATGSTAIFYHGWYRRLVAERVQRRVGDKAWSRACDEINEFEAQQHDHDTIIVKLYFHTTANVRAARIRERGDDPWRRHLPPQDEAIDEADRARTIEVLQDLFALTDTRWAPWRIVDAGDGRAAQLAALTMVTDALAKAIPAQPPATAEKVVPIRLQKSA